MNKIWEMYENLNEVVYVSDMDTYEIIYMNRKAREGFEYCREEDYREKKCYEVFQHSAIPCYMCTNDRLESGNFVEWKYANPVTQKIFLLKDTMIEDEGRKCRLEIAIDITNEENANEISSYNDYPSIINEGLRIALSQPSFDKIINTFLEYLGKVLRSERIYIFEENQCGNYDNTYEWCSYGVTPQIENLQNMEHEIADIWMDIFKFEGNVIIKHLEDTKEEDPLMYKYLYPQEIESLIVSPLVDNGQIVGFYGVDNPPADILEDISKMLWIIGFFIISMLKIRNLNMELENISLYDQLTGLGNRHAMDGFIEHLNNEESISVIYTDVLGLKKVNDTQGHQAGDKLIKNSCESLRRVFPQDALFRIGGDEFLVLCVGLTEEELNMKMEQLQEDMDKHSVRMSLGSVWRPDSTEDFDKLLAEADRIMYENKEQYYAEHGGKYR
jgi:diguanylate cyclase (GGDEF)-like protein